MKGIDAKWVFYLGIVITIEQAIGQGSVSLTNLIPMEWIPYVKSWSAFLALIGTTVMTGMSGYSSRTSGPLVSAPALPPAVKSALLIFAVLLASCILAMPAMAQGNKGNFDPLHLIKKPALTTNISVAAAPVTATAPATPLDALTSLMNDIEKISATTITNVIADITAANADASTVVTPATPTTAAVVKDPIAAACYPAAIQFLQSLPAATPPTGTLIGVQLFQKKRDFIAQIQAGLPVYLKLGCAPLLGDEITTFVNLMAMVGVKILPAAATALMPALAPITLPALTLAP